MTSPAFGHVVIVGVGLLGASLGLALKARGAAARITGVGRRQASLDTALRTGAIDAGLLDCADAVRDADLVIIATPAAQVVATLDRVRAAAPPHAVVTDVASTKAEICAHAAATWPAPRRFVGSHPMAGSHKFGPEHGDPALYAGAACLVEADPALDPQALDLVHALWNTVGGRVVDIAPETHDAMVARSSHLPHVVAAAVASVAAEAGDIAPFVGPGFRDSTRVAAGRPEVWRDICLTNRAALLDALDAADARLAAFRNALAHGDAAAVEAFFEAGRRARHETVGE
jgi:prephenate dehydrogenase